MVHYAFPIQVGTKSVSSQGDGYSACVTWYKAYPDVYTNKIAYHIYYSQVTSSLINEHTIEEHIFKEGVKLVVIDGSTEANIIDLTPGQQYFFCVRPVEYNPNIFDLSQLPISHDNIRFYPTSLLRQDMSATDLIVPLIDVGGFPETGVVKIGIELIQYLAIDPVNLNLIVMPSVGPGAAKLVLQSNNQYYLPNPTNIGDGYVNGLTLVNPNVGTETLKILCVFVEKDNLGNPIPGTAQFELLNSIPGAALDGYGNTIIWNVNGTVNYGGGLGFSITETSTFNIGDFFTVQTMAITPGVSGGRGYNNTPITSHTISGFDGYHVYNPIVTLFTLLEINTVDRIYACQSRFEYPNFPFTMVDGYNQVTTDILSSDLSIADASNVGFPMYDYAGYHRTDPVQILNGTCVGSYIGGQMGCIDGYGNYNIYRGFSLQDQNTQRQDVLLSIDGRPAVLIKRVQTGITCSCYLASSEYQDDRCPFCYGTKFVFGYEQYFNPRRSDGRILVRKGPAAETLKMYEAGLESEYTLDLWTLTVPTIKTRDVLVLFDQGNNEEFRYEVMDVTRNDTILGLDGGQKFKAMRIRKTDPAYQIRIFRDTSDFPSTLNTTLGFATGLPPHAHPIQVNEKVLSVSQINQTTGISQGHNHPIINGVVMEVLGHTHQIVLA